MRMLAEALVALQTYLDADEMLRPWQVMPCLAAARGGHSKRYQQHSAVLPPGCSSWLATAGPLSFQSRRCTSVPSTAVVTQRLVADACQSRPAA